MNNQISGQYPSAAYSPYGSQGGFQSKINSFNVADRFPGPPVDDYSSVERYFPDASQTPDGYESGYASQPYTSNSPYGQVQPSGQQPFPTTEGPAHPMDAMAVNGVSNNYGLTQADLQHQFMNQPNPNDFRQAFAPRFMPTPQTQSPYGNPGQFFEQNA